MPHDQIPEGLTHWILGVVGTVLSLVAGWVARLFFARMRRVERMYDVMNRRVVNLERLYAVHEARHLANVERLDRIERRAERIEDKLDRLLERGEYGG